jgi:Xaa-Pro aminopeptidase
VNRISERVNTPISTVELERRWAAVRAAMELRGIDVLVAQGNNDHMGGYVRWLCDLPATNGYPLTVVFPRAEAMTVVMHGPIGGDRELPPEGDGVLRGVGRVLTTASFASAPYTREYDAELAARGLEPYARATIGLVGTHQISFATVEHLRRRFPDAIYVEASDLVDDIKALKSDEEKELIRATAAIQDVAMEAALGAVEPGRRDSEIAAIARAACEQLGSEQGVYLCASSPPGEPAPIAPAHLQHRIMREGDVFALLVECNGPGGMFTELGRSCVVGGPAPPQLAEELAFAVEAQRFCVDLLRPGAPAAEVFAEYNAFLGRNGRPEEDRIHCHGQGYDMVERPLLRFDETMVVHEDHNITCHPTYVRGGFLCWVCDNFLAGRDGRFERIHRFPQEIVAR